MIHCNGFFLSSHLPLTVLQFVLMREWDTEVNNRAKRRGGARERRNNELWGNGATYRGMDRDGDTERETQEEANTYCMHRFGLVLRRTEPYVKSVFDSNYRADATNCDTFATF